MLGICKVFDLTISLLSETYFDLSANLLCQKWLSLLIVMECLTLFLNKISRVSCS
jgi:hypothetical protein